MSLSFAKIAFFFYQKERFFEDYVQNWAIFQFRACAWAKIWNFFWCYYPFSILFVAPFLCFFSALLVWLPFALYVLSGCREKLDAISFPKSSFPLTSGRKTRALGATISGMHQRCRLRSETGWAESPEFGYFKMVAPRALVFRPLVKENEDSGKEIEFDVNYGRSL